MVGHGGDAQTSEKKLKQVGQSGQSQN